MTHNAAAVEVDDADKGGRFNELKLTKKKLFSPILSLRCLLLSLAQ